RLGRAGRGEAPGIVARVELAAVLDRGGMDVSHVRVSEIFPGARVARSRHEVVGARSPARMNCNALPASASTRGGSLLRGAQRVSPPCPVAPAWRRSRWSIEESK